MKGQAQAKTAREGGSVRYSARVEYDGTDFAGFQVQPRGRTVQAEIERVLTAIGGGERVKVEGAGRTDAGVHSRGQVVAFTYPGRLAPVALRKALNGLLPADISIGRLRRVDEAFRPRYRARHREYRYSIWNGQRSALRERFVFTVLDKLDVAAMHEAALVFVGEHDFSAFGGKDRQPIRTVHKVKVRRRSEKITIVVVGNAFLRGMVRRMVAALLRVGRGQATVQDVRNALEGRAPAFKGEAAPAHGLVLWDVPMGPERNWKTEASSERSERQD